MVFKPKRVYFEPAALEYPLGRKLYKEFQEEGIPIIKTGSHNRVTGIPGKTPQEAYMEAKQTFVVGVRRTLKFETCKPSAHYQLPLCTSCIGKCEYCYLNTTLGKKPYLRVYVNIEEILNKTKEYIEKRKPEITYFEGAATSDPLPYEPYTKALAKTIEFFGKEELGRFRFVTKFTEVDSLLRIRHERHTRFRFSINTQSVIGKHEHSTPSAGERIEAACKVAQAGYPVGFLVAPVILYDNWQSEYKEMLEQLAEKLPSDTQKDLTFEIISHRYTNRAKRNIQEVFPSSELPMNEEERQFKYGQFGYGKYVYPKDELNMYKDYFTEILKEIFPDTKVDYII